MTDDPILVVIPYLPGEGQGRELEYAVAGWRRHFKDNHIIVLVGDGVSAVPVPGVVPIDSPRVAERPGQYRQHLDYVSCLRRVHEAFPRSKGYVRVADDCYAVRDFCLSDIQVPKIIGEIGKSSIAIPGSWQGDLQRTRATLADDGFPVHNYTTHLPQWFEWEKMERLWRRYRMDETSFVDENLYYNIYEGWRAAVNVHTDYQPYKCGIYRPNPRIDYIEGCIGTRIWITNSPSGWVPQLDMMLAKYYFDEGSWVWTYRQQ